jgi:hypothetical protein
METGLSNVKKSLLSRFFGHLHTVAVHKRYVRKACFKMGLYRQGIFHDMSKFSPTEFLPSVKYYDGTHSPTIEERKAKGYSACWIHHKGRNKHHYEYWTDYQVKKSPLLYPCRIPLRYVAEMVADRYAACVAYQGENYKQSSPWDYYEPSRQHIAMEPETKAVLEEVLLKMLTDGEEAAFDYMKSLLAVTKDSDYTAESLGIKIKR